MARTAGAGLALCIGALCANGAMGQSQRPSRGGLGEMLFEKGAGRKPAAPPVARYQAEGGVAFILDMSSGQPLLRFEGSNEIWALYPQAAPRGGVIYNNDAGQPVLRLWRGGGITVFTSTRPEGAAAALDGVGRSLRGSYAFTDAVAQSVRLGAASDRVSKAAGRQIGFYADDFDGQSAVVAVDAANVAVDAFTSLLRKGRDANALARIRQFVFLEGKAPSVVVKDKSLVITVVPGKGAAGRPSSAKIIGALKD